MEREAKEFAEKEVRRLEIEQDEREMKANREARLREEAAEAQRYQRE